MIQLTDRFRQTCLVLCAYLLIGIVIALAMQGLSHNNLAGVDGQRFHAMADAIISGLTPYVDFVDPKPPLIYFVIALVDLAAPAGMLDIPLMTAINVIAALLVWHLGQEEYGNIAGFSSGMFYLITAVFVQGYFLFSEQFVVLFLILALLSVRAKSYLMGGLLVGLAFGFKQYAILGAIPLLYLMHVQGSRKYYRRDPKFSHRNGIRLCAQYHCRHCLCFTHAGVCGSKHCTKRHENPV
jgi:Gpi18-like mannosyltransferase